MLQRTFALYEDDTVIDNVIKSISGHDEDEITDMAIDLIDIVQMTHRITHIARDLSGGEKQRVVLARQMAKEPMLFLADEPTGTLDPKTAELIHQALISGVKETGYYYGYNIPLAGSYAENYLTMSIWLEKGEIIRRG